MKKIIFEIAILTVIVIFYFKMKGGVSFRDFTLGMISAVSIILIIEIFKYFKNKKSKNEI